MNASEHKLQNLMKYGSVTSPEEKKMLKEKMGLTRRQVVRGGVLGSLALLASVTTACNAKIITWAGIVVSAFEQALPIFRDILPNSVAILTKALAVAKDLEAALKAGSANTVDLIEQLISPTGLFNQILNDVELITDPSKRKIVTGILLLAGIALRLISSGLQQGAPQIPATVMSKAKGKAGISVIQKVNDSDQLLTALANLKF